MKMKQVLKTMDKELVERFLAFIPYHWKYDTGNSRAMITHYGIDTGYTVEGEEIAQVSFNFDTKVYICRMAV